MSFSAKSSKSTASATIHMFYISVADSTGNLLKTSIITEFNLLVCWDCFPWVPSVILWLNSFCVKSTFTAILVNVSRHPHIFGIQNAWQLCLNKMEFKINNPQETQCHTLQLPKCPQITSTITFHVTCFWQNFIWSSSKSFSAFILE